MTVLVAINGAYLTHPIEVELESVDSGSCPYCGARFHSERYVWPKRRMGRVNFKHLCCCVRCGREECPDDEIVDLSEERTVGDRIYEGFQMLSEEGCWEDVSAFDEGGDE